MRSIWKGTISFGLVNIPIALGVATQRSDPKFRTLDAETNQPIRQQMVSAARDDAVVERTETVKGYEVGKGQFVVVTRRGARERRGRAPADHRHHLVHRHRRGRPGLLRPHLLRRAAGGGQQAVHPAARGAQADRQGRGRQDRPVEQGAPRPAAPVRRRARDRAPLLPRGRAHLDARRDRGRRPRHEGREGRARHGEAARREPVAPVRAGRVRERAQARPDGADREEARRRGDRGRAGARGAPARAGPDGRASGLARPGQGREAQGRRKARGQDEEEGRRQRLRRQEVAPRRRSHARARRRRPSGWTSPPSEPRWASSRRASRWSRLAARPG